MQLLYDQITQHQDRIIDSCSIDQGDVRGVFTAFHREYEWTPEALFESAGARKLSTSAKIALGLNSAPSRELLVGLGCISFATCVKWPNKTRNCKTNEVCFRASDPERNTLLRKELIGHHGRDAHVECTCIKCPS